MLAVDNRLLLAIDDVQWLDAPSLAMLRFALPRLQAEPVAVILTARNDAPLWLHRGVPQARLTIRELGPLSVGALNELLRIRVGVVLPRPTLLRVWETSGGNPFFALELASALQRRGGRIGPGEELPIPSSLEELVHERVDRLRAPGLEVARLVAALAEPTVSLVEAAAGCRRGERAVRRARSPNPRARRGSPPLHASTAPLGGLVTRDPGATAVAARAACRRRSEHGGKSAASRTSHRRAEPRDRLPPRGRGSECARTGSTGCGRRAGRTGYAAHTGRGCRRGAPARPRQRREAPRGRRRPSRDRPARAVARNRSSGAGASRDPRAPGPRGGVSGWPA